MNSRRPHSITSSARASSDGGTSRPSALAVLRLIDELEFHRLLHRQVGRFLALEKAAGIVADQAERVAETGSVAHQAAGGGEIAPFINRGKRVARRQRHELIASALQERIELLQQRTPSLVRDGGEGRLDIAFAAGFENDQLLPQREPPQPARRSCQALQPHCSGLQERRSRQLWEPAHAATQAASLRAPYPRRQHR